MQLRIAFLLLVLGASGCAWMPFIGRDKVEDEAQTTEDVLYNSARASMRSGSYNMAVEKLERLEARFPFGRYAEQAQLELIYARLMSHSLDDAEAAADRFLRLHPQHPHRRRPLRDPLPRLEFPRPGCRRLRQELLRRPWEESRSRG